VQELRKDLAHYSAQMGLILAPGEAGRDARSEASAAGQAPVALYAGDALPEELIACRVGVTVQSVEVPDLDEAFLAGLSRHREERPVREERSREERRPRDRHEPQDEARPEPAAAQPDTEEIAQEASPAEAPVQEPVAADAAPAAETPPEPVSGPEAPQPDAAAAGEARESRRRGGGREERPRATNPSEQAWGQPAGTLRFAAPPGPTVVASGEPQAAPPEPAPTETGGGGFADDARSPEGAAEGAAGFADDARSPQGAAGGGQEDAPPPAADRPKSDPF
jgi:ribonuclease E